MTPSPDTRTPEAALSVECKYCGQRLTLNPEAQPIAAHELMRAHLIHHHVRELANIASATGWLTTLCAFASRDRRWRRHAISVLDARMEGRL